MFYNRQRELALRKMSWVEYRGLFSLLLPKYSDKLVHSFLFINHNRGCSILVYVYIPLKKT